VFSALSSERYGRHLGVRHLDAFDAHGASYEVSFHLKRLRAGASLPDFAPGNAVVRNRRFVKALQLQREGEYFSETAMRERAPKLFEKLIGRYDQGAGASSQVRAVVSRRTCP